MVKVKNVNIDGFWSLAMYNKEGYFNKKNMTPMDLETE